MCVGRVLARSMDHIQAGGAHELFACASSSSPKKTRAQVYFRLVGGDGVGDGVGVPETRTRRMCMTHATNTSHVVSVRCRSRDVAPQTVLHHRNNPPPQSLINFYCSLHMATGCVCDSEQQQWKSIITKLS